MNATHAENAARLTATGRESGAFTGRGWNGRASAPIGQAHEYSRAMYLEMIREPAMEPGFSGDDAGVVEAAEVAEVETE